MATATVSSAQRIRSLVDRVHGGSVNAAAKDIGIPQQTLAKIVSGDSENPRAAAVAAIARFYGTRSEWILDGEGEEPVVLNKDTRFPLAEQKRYAALTNRLGLSDRASFALWAWPENQLSLVALDEEPMPPIDSELGAKFIEVWRGMLKAATDLVEFKIQQLGEERAREYFEERAAVVTLAPTIAEELLKNGALNERDVFTAVETTHLRGGFSPELSAARAGRKAPAKPARRPKK